MAEVEKQLAYRPEDSSQYYNTQAHPLPYIHIDSIVAFQNPQTKSWGIYSTVTEIGPHRRYYIKTHGGCILVRNCGLLHHRVPPLSAPCLTNNPLIDTSQESAAPIIPSRIYPPPPSRSSSHTRNSPQRLIKSPN